MTDLKTMLLCNWVNFRKWPVNPRICTLAVIIAGFLARHTAGLSQLSAALGIPVTPWVFPHLIVMPAMVAAFGGFTTLLFCDAPFMDSHMPFVVVRTGRRNWVMGQLLYIALASLVYTAFFCIVSVLVLIPHVQLSAEWGILFKTIAANPEIALDRGISLSIFANPQFITMLTPVKAMLISFGLFWLTSVFVGVLIFCFNIVIGKMSGLVAAAALIAISYFSIYFGPLSFGGSYWIRYLSPINWCSIYFLDWNGTGEWASPAYAVIFLSAAILLMSIVSAVVFCKKDLNIQERGR